MGFTLIILFVISAVLLIISIMKTIQAAHKERKNIDLVHIALMKDIDELKESIRGIELEKEVLLEKTGVQLSLEELGFMRDVLDLYRRSYSIESIAEKKGVSVEEIQEVLAPYLATGSEGRKTANAV